jgi:hypothetical protein
MKKKEIEFAEWLGSNHYVLCNESKGIHFWENEDSIGTTNDLYIKFNKEQIKDTIVESVINQFKQRSEAGINKYGVTLDRTDLSTLEWLQHFQEELMDATLYIQKLKTELNDKEQI